MVWKALLDPKLFPGMCTERLRCLEIPLGFMASVNLTALANWLAGKSRSVIPLASMLLFPESDLLWAYSTAS